jgi:hypothetical protein
MENKLGTLSTMMICGANDPFTASPCWRFIPGDFKYRFEKHYESVIHWLFALFSDASSPKISFSKNTFR